MLDDRSLRRQVAFQYGNASIGAHGMSKIPDDVRPVYIPVDCLALAFKYPVAVFVEPALFKILQVFPQCLSRDRHHIQVEHFLDLSLIHI